MKTTEFRSHGFLARVLGPLVLLGTFAGFSWSDEDEGSEYFEEVIVTAERKEENVLDTPMTLTAFSSSMLEQLGVQDRDKLQNLVPGLQFGDTGDQEGNGTTLRGIGTRVGGIEHRDRSVATYIDGAYTVGVYGTAPGGGFDLERVEVARGPQGTLNGRNSIAGSINYVYKKPSDEWDVDVMAQVTDVSQQRFNAAIGGPLMENLSFRITGGVYTGDGYQENVGIGPDHAKPDHQFYAGQLRFKTDRFDSNLRYSYVQDTGVPRSLVQLANLNTTDENFVQAGAYSIGTPPPNLAEIENVAHLYATQNPAGPADCPVGRPYMHCGNGEISNKVALNYLGYEDSSSEGINFYAQYDLTDTITVKYTFNDRDTNQMNVKDADYMNRYAVAGGDHTIASDGGARLRDRFYELPYQYEETSHELLVTADVNERLTVIAGYFQYENDSYWAIVRNETTADFRYGTADYWAQEASPVFGFLPVSSCQEFLETGLRDTFGYYIDPVEAKANGQSYWWCPEGDEHTRIVNYQTSAEQESEAIFLNADYEINDKWAVSAGIRTLEDWKYQGPLGQGGDYTLSFGGALVTVGYQDGGFDKPHTWDAVVGQLTAEYTTEGNNLLYARFSTGHKAGQFNLLSTGTSGIDPVVDAVELDNYELGSKGTYLDGRLQLAVGAFLMDYDGFHLSALQPLTEGSTVGVWEPSPLPEYTANVPGTTIWGLEIEYNYAMTDNLRFMGFYAYQDSEVGPHESVVRGDPDAGYALWDHIDFDTGEPVQSYYTLPMDQTGNQLPSQPNHKFAATGVYDIALDADMGSLSLLTTYSFTGYQYPTIANIDLYKVDGYHRVDASAIWTSADETISATFFVNNVFDKIGLNEFVAVSGLGEQVFLGMPTNHREMGLTIRYRPSI